MKTGAVVSFFGLAEMPPPSSSTCWYERQLLLAAGLEMKWLIDMQTWGEPSKEHLLSLMPKGSWDLNLLTHVKIQVSQQHRREERFTFFFCKTSKKIHQSGLRLSDVKLLSALLKALLLLLMRPANSKSLERKPLYVERQRKHQEQSHAPHSAQPSLKIPRRAVKKVLLTKRHCFCLTSC